jgi:hypothetical protein
MTTNFFSPLSFVAVFGSGIRDPRSGIWDLGSWMGKNQDPGSGIWDKHPGSATLDFMLVRSDPILDLGSGSLDNFEPGSDLTRKFRIRPYLVGIHYTLFF